MRRPTKSIQGRLMLYVSLALLGFSVISGGLTYQLAYKRELAAASTLEQQLVRTIQSQAEVAAFAANTEIAKDVIAGLLANPRFLSVALEADSLPPFRVSEGYPGKGAELHVYPLYSPVDGKRPIGKLTLTRKDSLIHDEAARRAIEQTSLLLIQVIATALLILLFSRYLLGKPVAKLAKDLAAIQPGSKSRVSIPENHADDEIGSLAESANSLLDTTEKTLAELEALATTDALTSLPNRRAFMLCIDTELARVKRQESPPSSLLMLDLDHFKQINDHYGHAAGDAVLREFGVLLAAELRKIDTCGRLGGEEFAAVLHGADAMAASMFAERLRTKVADMRVKHGPQSLEITVSIGIAEMRSNSTQVEEVMTNADRALYEAKRTGRNRVVAYTGHNGLDQDALLSVEHSDDTGRP